MSLPDSEAAGLAPEQLAARRQALESDIRTGSSWLWSVVGFSVVNTVLLRVGCDLSFCVGLLLTQVNDYASIKFARDTGGDTALASYFIDALLVGGFALCARMCARKRRWMVMAGLVVYAVDTALLASAQVGVSLAIHGLTLWCVYQAFRAIGELHSLPLPEALPAAAAAPLSKQEPAPALPVAREWPPLAASPPLAVERALAPNASTVRTLPPPARRSVASAPTAQGISKPLLAVSDDELVPPRAETVLTQPISGIRALIVGLVVLGALTVGVYAICKFCDDAVAMR